VLTYPTILDSWQLLPLSIHSVCRPRGSAVIHARRNGQWAWVVWIPWTSILLKFILFPVCFLLPWPCQTAFFAANRSVCVSGRLRSSFCSVRGNEWQTTYFLQPVVRGVWSEHSGGIHPAVATQKMHWQQCKCCPVHESAFFL